TLPKNVDHEDLYSAGVLGLLDAHAKFDPRKGVKFETYAVWRIKGAVLDQLRALDWVSRSLRRKARNLDGVTRKLDQKLGRAAAEKRGSRGPVLGRRPRAARRAREVRPPQGRQVRDLRRVAHQGRRARPAARARLGVALAAAQGAQPRRRDAQARPEARPRRHR